MKDLLSREEIDRPGVYILVGNDTETGKAALYVGEAESVSKRIKGHSEKDFWNSAVVFVSKDANLTKAHSKYLEGKLIDKATKAGRAILENSVSSGSRLPESDEAEMNVFLDNIYQLLPVLGITYFRTNQEETATEKELLYCKIKGLVASGKRSANGFVVFKGSEAVKEHRKSAKSIKTIRQRLIDLLSYLMGR